MVKFKADGTYTDSSGRTLLGWVKGNVYTCVRRVWIIIIGEGIIFIIDVLPRYVKILNSSKRDLNSTVG